jgi:hypothetical protein
VRVYGGLWCAVIPNAGAGGWVPLAIEEAAATRRRVELCEGGELRWSDVLGPERRRRGLEDQLEARERGPASACERDSRHEAQR